MTPPTSPPLSPTPSSAKISELLSRPDVKSKSNEGAEAGKSIQLAIRNKLFSAIAQRSSTKDRQVQEETVPVLNDILEILPKPETIKSDLHLPGSKVMRQTLEI